MSRICPLTIGALLMGLASVSTWLLLSADVLHQASFFFVH